MVERCRELKIPFVQGTFEIIDETFEVGEPTTVVHQPVEKPPTSVDSKPQPEAQLPLKL